MLKTKFKGILNIQKKEKKIFVVLNVRDMSSMVRKEFCLLVVIFVYIKNVQELPRLNTKILETIRSNLGTAKLVKPTGFLFMA